MHSAVNIVAGSFDCKSEHGFSPETRAISHDLSLEVKAGYQPREDRIGILEDYSAKSSGWLRPAIKRRSFYVFANERERERGETKVMTRSLRENGDPVSEFRVSGGRETV